MDSDPDLEIIEKDSGMSSLGGSKDETPERRTVSAINPTPSNVNNSEGENSYEDEPDETLAERLWGLTEMFPDCVRNTVETVATLTSSGVKGAYNFTCNASWIFFTSSIILFAPVIFETERAQMIEMQRSQHKQVLMGPGTAIAAAGSPALPPMIQR